MNSQLPRVLYISPNGFLGGAERFVLEICQSHQKNNQYQGKILFFSGGTAVDQARQNNLDFQILNNRLRLSNPLSVIKTSLAIRKIVDSYRPDIIHLTMPYSHLATILPTINSNIKKVWFQHGPVGGWMDQAASFIPVDAILFHSEFLKNEHALSTYGPEPKKGFHIVPIGIPAVDITDEQVQKIKQEISVKDGQLLIGMCGRITQWKGFDTLIRAADLLREQDRSAFKKLKFIIIGQANTAGDQKFLQELHREIERRHLQDSIQLTGFVDSIHPYYAAMDIFVHASKVPEPYGVVAAEAMAHQTLVVGSNQGGLTEILQDGKTGLTYDSTLDESDSILATRLKDAVDGFASERFQTMIKNGYELIRGKYSFNAMSEAVADVYKKVLS